MLIEFKFQNFKSFTDTATFSMMKQQKQKGLDYSLYRTKVNGKALNLLCSSVVYGPNAAGKTTLIGAMDVFRSIIINGHIRNNQSVLSPANPALEELRLIPNKDLGAERDTGLSIEVLLNGMRIRYSLKMQLGKFFDIMNEDNRHITSEELFVNGKMIFSRGDSIEVGALNAIKRYVVKNADMNIGYDYMLNRSLNKTELFLTNGFKLVFAPDFVKMFVDWVENKFRVIYRFDELNLKLPFKGEQKRFYSEAVVNNAAKMFGVNSNAVGYIAKEDGDSELVSVIERGMDPK